MRSLTSKIDELRCTQGVCNQDASAIGLTESHLSSAIDNSEVVISGYKLFRRDRTGRQGGGVICYVLNKFNCVRRYNFESDSVESLWLELIQAGSSPLLIVSYIGPQIL